MKTILLSLLIYISTGFAQYSTIPNTIMINAVKDTVVTANEMVVEISVRKIDTSSSKVNEETHSILINVLDVLKKYGYKKENIYLISSSTNNDNFRKKEFFSNQTYKIILNKFDVYDQLKKELLHAGATGVRISTFWLTDYKKVKQALYNKAIADAKLKAEYFCSQIGAKNPTVEIITDNSRDESINRDISFIRRTGSAGINSVIVVPQRGMVAPTITNGKLNINVMMRITFKYSY